MQENSILTPRAKDQVLGCMVSGAVGDALGYAVEFISYDSIVKKYGERGITQFALDRHGVAEISDDTQMSLFTAAGILLGMTRSYIRGIMGRIDTYCHWTYLGWPRGACNRYLQRHQTSGLFRGCRRELRKPLRRQRFHRSRMRQHHGSPAWPQRHPCALCRQAGAPGCY